MKSQFACLVAAGLTALCLGPPIAAAAPTQPYAATANSDRVETTFANSQTRRRIRVETIQFSLAGALPRAEVALRNTTGQERRFDYLIEWKTADGQDAQTNSTWRTVFLAPNEVETITSVGQVESAYSARLIIREVRMPRPAKERS